MDRKQNKSPENNTTLPTLYEIASVSAIAHLNTLQATHGHTINASLIGYLLRFAHENFKDCIRLETIHTASTQAASRSSDDTPAVIERRGSFVDTQGYMQTQIDFYLGHPTLNADVKQHIMSKLAEPVDPELDCQIVDSIEGGQLFSTKWTIPLSVVFAVVMIVLTDKYSGGWQAIPGMTADEQEEMHIAKLHAINELLMLQGKCHTDYRNSWLQSMAGYKGMAIELEQFTCLLKFINEFIVSLPIIQQALISPQQFRELLLPWALSHKKEKMPLPVQDALIPISQEIISANQTASVSDDQTHAGHVITTQSPFTRKKTDVALALQLAVKTRHLLELGKNTDRKEHKNTHEQIVKFCMRSGLTPLPCRFTPLLAQIHSWAEKYTLKISPVNAELKLIAQKIIEWLETDFVAPAQIAAYQPAASSSIMASSSTATDDTLDDEVRFFWLSQLFDTWQIMDKDSHLLARAHDATSPTVLGYFYDLKQRLLQQNLLDCLPSDAAWTELSRHLEQFNKNYTAIRTATQKDFIEQFPAKWCAAITPNEEGVYDVETCAKWFYTLVELKRRDHDKPEDQWVITLSNSYLNTIYEGIKAAAQANQHNKKIELAWYQVNQVLLHAITTPFTEWTDVLSLCLQNICEFIEAGFNPCAQDTEQRRHELQALKTTSYPQRFITHIRSLISEYDTRREQLQAERETELSQQIIEKKPGLAANVLGLNDLDILYYLAITPDAKPDVIAYVLDSGINIHKSWSNGFTPLMSACREGHLALAQALIKRGGWLDFRAIDEALSARSHRWQIVAELIRAGIELSFNHGYKLLCRAVQEKQVSIVHTLLQRGIKTHPMGDKIGLRLDLTSLPLYIALKNGDDDSAKVLLQAGAIDTPPPYIRSSYDANIRVKISLLELAKDLHKLEWVLATAQLSPLMYALLCYRDTRFLAEIEKDDTIRNDALEQLKALTQQESNFNQQDCSGKTALHWAIISHVVNETTIHTLIQGTDLRIQDHMGRTPLMLAILYKRDLIVKAIMGKPPMPVDVANVLLHDESTQRDLPLVSAPAVKTVVIEQDIPQLDVDMLKLCDHEGQNTLHYAFNTFAEPTFEQALHLFYAKLSEQLIALGLDVNTQDKSGNNVLMSMLEHRYEFGMIEIDPDERNEQQLLLPSGYRLDPNLKLHKDQKTALMIALLYHAKPEVIWQLLETGAQLDLKDNRGNTALHHAILSATSHSDAKLEPQEQLKLIALLLLYGAKTDSRDQFEETPLMVLRTGANNVTLLSSPIDGDTISPCIKSNHAQAIENLLHGLNRDLVGAGINDADTLLLAAFDGDDATIKRLLTLGVDPNSDIYGLNALNVAARRGHIEVVRALLEHGAYPDIGYSSGANAENTALYHAIHNNDDEMAKLLLRHGAAIHSYNCPFYVNGVPIDTTLFLALKKQKLAFLIEHAKLTPLMLHMLIYAYAKARNKFNPPEEAASSSTEIDNYPYQIVLTRLRVLLNNSHILNQQDNHGRTALQWAMRVKLTEPDIINHLVKHTDPNIICTDYNQLILAISTYGRIDVAQALLDMHPNCAFLSLDDNGRSALHHAAIARDDFGHDLNTESVIGLTKVIVELLRRNSAFASLANKQGDTPLHFAICRPLNLSDNRLIAENGKVIELLLSYGAEINVQNHQGNTPLHLAVIRYFELFETQLVFKKQLVAENSQIIQLLLTHGANINAQNHQGDTPLMILFKSAHKAYKKEALLACLAFPWSNVDLGLTNQEAETIPSLAKQHGIDLTPYIGDLSYEPVGYEARIQRRIVHIFSWPQFICFAVFTRSLR